MKREALGGSAGGPNFAPSAPGSGLSCVLVWGPSKGSVTSGIGRTRRSTRSQDELQSHTQFEFRRPGGGASGSGVSVCVREPLREGAGV